MEQVEGETEEVKGETEEIEGEKEEIVGETEEIEGETEGFGILVQNGPERITRVYNYVMKEFENAF